MPFMSVINFLRNSIYHSNQLKAQHKAEIALSNTLHAIQQLQHLQTMLKVGATSESVDPNDSIVIQKQRLQLSINIELQTLIREIQKYQITAEQREAPPGTDANSIPRNFDNARLNTLLEAMAKANPSYMLLERYKALDAYLSDNQTDATTKLDTLKKRFISSQQDIISDVFYFTHIPYQLIQLAIQTFSMMQRISQNIFLPVFFYASIIPAITGVSLLIATNPLSYVFLGLAATCLFLSIVPFTVLFTLSVATKNISAQLIKRFPDLENIHASPEIEKYDNILIDKKHYGLNLLNQDTQPGLLESKCARFFHPEGHAFAKFIEHERALVGAPKACG